MASSSISQYLLRWNDHLSNYGDMFLSLREQEEFVDCTIACEDGIVGAHRMVLAGCSPYLRDLFNRVANPHPVIFLLNTSRSLVIMLMEFIYKGQVHIPNNRLQQLVMLGQSLRIKGLTQITVPAPETSARSAFTPMAFPHGLPISPGGLPYAVPADGLSSLGVSILSCDNSQEEVSRETLLEQDSPEQPSRKNPGRKKKIHAEQNEEILVQPTKKSLKKGHRRKNNRRPYPVAMKERCHLAAHAVEHGIEAAKRFARSLYNVDMRTSTIMRLMKTYGNTKEVQKAKAKREATLKSMDTA